jgi:hypothetical protein
MNTKLLFTGIFSLALVFGFMSCDDDKGGGASPSTKGKLTITGLESYNGNFAFASTMIGASEQLVGGKATGAESVEAVPISNGQVELPVYIADATTRTFKSFEKTGPYALVIVIISSKVIPQSEAERRNIIKESSSAQVDFTHGVGVLSSTNISWINTGE